jgi:hypothetical protein
MFSDLVSDQLHALLKSMHRAHPDIYPREVMVQLIASLLLARYVSDWREPDGTFFGGATLQELKTHSDAEAAVLYDQHKDRD